MQKIIYERGELIRRAEISEKIVDVNHPNHRRAQQKA